MSNGTTPVAGVPTRLPSGEVHLWWASVSQHQEQLPYLRTLLSQDECARADRYLVEPPRRSFIVAHGLIRLLLARYTGQAPRNLVFTYSARGKPALAGGGDPPAIGFNLSHSGDLVVAGLTSGCDLGADVEQLRPMPSAVDLTARFFAAAEHRTLLSLGEHRRSEAFLRCWTYKEAYLKAVGSGIGDGLSGVEASIDPAQPPCLLRVGGSKQEASRWLLLSCQPCPEYVAAVVVPHGTWKLVLHRAAPESIQDLPGDSVVS